VNYLVRTRNLSPTGIAFLHGSFVYTGTGCVLALHDAQGKIVGVEGKVVRCQHVRGHVHDIGVRFSRPLDVKQFLLATGEVGGRGGQLVEGRNSRDGPDIGDLVSPDEISYRLGPSGKLDSARLDVTTCGRDYIPTALSSLNGDRSPRSYAGGFAFGLRSLVT